MFFNEKFPTALEETKNLGQITFRMKLSCRPSFEIQNECSDHETFAQTEQV